MLKVGDRVFDIRFGWGEVVKYKNDEYYPCPVIAKFLSEEDEVSYTKDGKEWTSHLNPMLFFEEFVIPEIALIRPKWRAEKGSHYHYINEFGSTMVRVDKRSPSDDRRFEVGNYFKTEEESINSDLYKAYKKEGIDSDV